MMASLLISKINDVEVIQVGDSKLSIEHKYVKSRKVGSKPANKAQEAIDGYEKLANKALTFISGVPTPVSVSNKKSSKKLRQGGSNTSVDLGRGAKKHQLKIYVMNREDNDKIFKILYHKRYCTIVDKFKGKIKVYIDTMDIVDSDTHVNRTIYDISCTVQDLEKSPSVNFSVKLSKVVKDIQDELPAMVKNMKGDIDDFGTTFNPVKDVFDFIDPTLRTINKGIGAIISLRREPSEYLNSFLNKVNMGRALFKSLTMIEKTPDDFTNLITKLTNDSFEEPDVRKTNVLTSHRRVVSSIIKSEILPILKPKVVVSTTSGLEAQPISEIALLNIKKETSAYLIVNKVKVIKDIKSLLGGGFNSRDDFEDTVNAIVDRLEYVGYSGERIGEIVHLIKSFANEQIYKDIVTINIPEEQPLLRIVYNLYGSIDNYEQIRALNNFKDNDYISGDVSVFL